MNSDAAFRKHDLYLTIDQGGHGSRAIVFNYEGVVVSEGYAKVTVEHPKPGWVEQDPQELVTSIREAIERAIAPIENRVTQIVAAGLATQRSSIACWDRNTGETLTPIISWQDRRAADWLSRFDDKSDFIHMRTGLFMSPHYGASKLRWCLDHVDVVKKAFTGGRLCFGPMASWLVYALTNEQSLLCDPANASRTLLWNIKTLAWDDELLSLFDIPKAALPECVPTRHHYGHIKYKQHDIPLTIVNGDQSAAIFSYGVVQPDTAYVNVGTGAFVSRISGSHALYGRRLLASIVYQEKEPVFVLEGTVNGAASALDWVEETCGVHDVVKNLPTWLEESKSPPLFMNGVSGLGAPFWISDFPVEFIGRGEDKDKVVAVVESIVFLIESNMKEMLSLASPPQLIQITGGLARLDGMCQRLADVSGLAVYRPAEGEATARGVAWLLANCPRHWPELEMGVWFKPKPNPQLVDRFKAWEDAMHELMRGRKSA